MTKMMMRIVPSDIESALQKVGGRRKGTPRHLQRTASLRAERSNPWQVCGRGLVRRCAPRYEGDGAVSKIAAYELPSICARERAGKQKPRATSSWSRGVCDKLDRQ